MRFLKKIFYFNFLVFAFIALPAYSYAATLYFDGRVSGDWNSLSNWWTDSGLTSQALSLPSSSDDVIISATVSSNTGVAASVNSLVFNDGGSSYYLGINTTVASGATFNGSSYNRGVLTGNAKFNTTYFSGTAPSGGILTLTSSKQWRGRVTGTVTGSDDAPITSYVFNNTSNVGGASTIVGNVSFYNTSTCTMGGVLTITGDVTFNDSVACASGTINITGNAVFNNTSRNNGATINITSGTATFNDTSHNDANIIGTAIFNEDSYNYSTVTGNATFNDNSYSRYRVIGDAIFNDNSYNIGSITGNADVYYPSQKPIGGTISGTITYHNYPPVISESVPIAIGTDATPNYVFITDKDGVITYGGSCSSDTVNAVSGSNTLTFNELAPNTYSDCTIVVTDSDLNPSNTLLVTAFTIQSTPRVSGSRSARSSNNSINNSSISLNPSTINKSDNAESRINIVPNSLTPEKIIPSSNNFVTNLFLKSPRSESVRQLQVFLNNNGFTVTNSGNGSLGNESNYFGPFTRAALAKFQLAVGIKPANGYFGPITRAYINSLKK